MFALFTDHALTESDQRGISPNPAKISKATGNRLRQQLIDEKTRAPVAPEDKGRGYEVAKGQYLIVDDAELDDRVMPWRA